MLGPFTFTFTFESEEFEKFEKVGALPDLYQTMITTRAPDGANKFIKSFLLRLKKKLTKHKTTFAEKANQQNK